MTSEIWKDIPSLQGYYQASDLGNIRSVTKLLPWKSKTGTPGFKTRKGKVLSPNNAKYKQVNLSISNKQFTRYVHRLVAETFVEGFELGFEVDHINGNKHDNRPENLRWVSHSDNLLLAYDNNQHRHGERSHMSKISEQQVFDIIDMYGNGEIYSQEEVGHTFGISQGQVGNLVRGKSWKRLTR